MENTNMVKQLSFLESVALELEPVHVVRNNIATQALQYVDDFLETMSDKPTYNEATCDVLKTFSVDEEGKPLATLLDVLKTEVDHAGINSASGGHLGYIPAGGLWTSAIADMLAAATNRYAGIFYSSPGAVMIENQMIKWLSTVVGYPTAAHGNLCSGGSIANLVAVQTARDSRQLKAANFNKAVIYFTAQAHHCIQKALQTTGLHEAVHRIVPMNENFEMDTNALATTIKEDLLLGLRPFMVIASAGTTDTGAVDPLDIIADICEQHKIWFHVDAAYGGFFLLVPDAKMKFKGIERSDSVVMDPHKGMFIPYGIGAVLIRNGDALVKTYSHQASYMQDAYGFDELSPADCGPELSKHFRGLRMWLPLHLHGLKPFRANLEEKLLLTKYFYIEIQKLGFETGLEPQLSVTLFRYKTGFSNMFNKELVEKLHQDGRYFFSSTMINGEVWIRCAILSFRTHLHEINGALQMLKENLAELKENVPQ